MLDFFQAIDHIINSAAKSNYMSAGQINVPIVFRGPNGAAAGVGAQHSQVNAYTNLVQHTFSFSQKTNLIICYFAFFQTLPSASVASDNIIKEQALSL